MDVTFTQSGGEPVDYPFGRVLQTAEGTVLGPRQPLRLLPVPGPVPVGEPHRDVLTARHQRRARCAAACGSGADGHQRHQGQPVAVPGSGWPDDPASTTTPVARSAEDVVRLSANAPTLDHVGARVSVCCACPRLLMRG